jgi:hypothetical protein
MLLSYKLEMKLHKKNIKSLSSGMQLVPNEITPLIVGGAINEGHHRSLYERYNLQVDLSYQKIFIGREIKELELV